MIYRLSFDYFPMNDRCFFEDLIALKSLGSDPVSVQIRLLAPSRHRKSGDHGSLKYFQAAIFTSSAPRKPKARLFSGDCMDHRRNFLL